MKTTVITVTLICVLAKMMIVLEETVYFSDTDYSLNGSVKTVAY